jgi:hypothetical protein
VIDRDDLTWLIALAENTISHEGGRDDSLRLDRIKRAFRADGEPQTFRCYCWRAPEPHPEHVHLTERHEDGRRLRASFPRDFTPSLVYAVAVRINATHDLAKEGRVKGLRIDMDRRPR